MDRNGLIEHGPITIVAFGDSITFGAFANGEIDYESVYWNVLRKMINNVRLSIPVNVINAGIGGMTATSSLPRLESQVLSHSPDLVIVSFVLNDVGGDIDVYRASLRTIFEKCLATGAETVFMTQCMYNTYVAEGTAEEHLAYAHKTAERQNRGLLDKYMDAAKEVASSMGVPVADCYAEWKKLYELGVDTTLLLANKINHPTREMHKLFAQKIFDIILGDAQKEKEKDISMCEEALKKQ